MRSKRFTLAAVLVIGVSAVAIGSFRIAMMHGSASHGTDGFSLSGVLNAADHSGGGVAPREIVVLHSSRAGPDRLAEWPTIFPRSASDLAYLRQRPDWGRLGETRVLFDRVPAAVVYAVSGQVEAVVPDSVSGRANTQVVLEYKGVRSQPLKLPVVPSAPAIFTLDSSGVGQAAILNETGCCNSARNPATRGSIASLYATGEGLLQGPVKVTVGNMPAGIMYSGNLGELVVNFRVPEGAPIGSAVPVVLTVGNARSRDGVTMAIRSSVRAILVVERNPVIRSQIAEALSAAGYRVFPEADWHHAEADTVDLVIAGTAAIDRAETEGIAALRARHPLMKLIALAPDTGPAFLRRADLLGANAVLPLPVSANMLLPRVRTLLRERPARY